MARVTLPEPIYRGDPWELPLYFYRDISASTFRCQLRHRRDGTALTPSIDYTHNDDPVVDDEFDAPYIVLRLTATQTAAITDNLLNGDVQEVGGITLAKFTVPVAGEYEVASA